MHRRFEVGTKVYSSQHGVGEVLAVEGFGEAERMTLKFDATGVREFPAGSILLEPYGEQAAEAMDPPAPDPTLGRVVLSSDSPAREDLEAMMSRLLEAALARAGVHPAVQMMDRWRGGTVVLKPGRPGVKEKEIPLDDFFHKIVMVRDRLRVLEQKVNAHPGLSDADKVELQQYVTRIYGSLTTFNVLFADRADWFVGQKGSESS